MNKQTQAFDMSDSPKHPKYALTQFSPEEFLAFWPKLEKELDRIPHTWRHWTKDYLQQAVLNNVVQVWGIGPPPNAILILFTQVSIFPAMRVLNVSLALGSLEDDMLPLLDATFVNYARLNDCREVEVRGRMGWDPHLKGVGYKRTDMVWTREVSSVRIN